MSLEKKLAEKKEELAKKQEDLSYDKKIRDIKNIDEEKKLLLDQKNQLANLVKELKDLYSKAQGNLDELKKSKIKIEELFSNYEEVLAELGIKNKNDLIESSSYKDEEEVSDYKNANFFIRDSVKELAKKKKAVKEEYPRLNFRGGRKKDETKSPREKVWDFFENKIAQIDEKTEELDSKQREMIGEKDLNSFDFLKREAQKEFDSTPSLKKENMFSNPNYDFRVNDKPGFYGPTEEVLKIGDKYGEEIVKDIYSSKLLNHYYPDNEKKGFEYESKDRNYVDKLKKTIDVLWDFRKLVNFEYSKDFSDAIQYLTDSKKGEKFLKLISIMEKDNHEEQLDFRTVLKVSQDRGYLTLSNLSLEEDYKELVKLLGDINKEIENFIKDKNKETTKASEKKIFFNAEAKRERFRLQYNFFDELIRLMSSGVPNDYDNFIKMGKVDSIIKRGDVIDLDDLKYIKSILEKRKNNILEMHKTEKKMYKVSNFIKEIPSVFLKDDFSFFENIDKVSLEDLKGIFEKMLEKKREKFISSGQEKEAQKIKEVSKNIFSLIKNEENVFYDTFLRNQPNRILEDIKNRVSPYL
ncbi:MAG: hypothetical protein WC928_03795 [Patescibacteria group bacterium]|jgi:hypothetical protein